MDDQLRIYEELKSLKRRREGGNQSPIETYKLGLLHPLLTWISETVPGHEKYGRYVVNALMRRPERKLKGTEVHHKGV